MAEIDGISGLKLRDEPTGALGTGVQPCASCFPKCTTPPPCWGLGAWGVLKPEVDTEQRTQHLHGRLPSARG